MKWAKSLYNSPIFCILKKQSQGLRVVQDFREINNQSHSNKYSMKEITQCISDIGRANSTIFSLLDLTSGFWQMQLKKSHNLSRNSQSLDKATNNGSLHQWGY